MLHEIRRAGYHPIFNRVESELDFRSQLQSAPEIILADFSLPQFDALRALEIISELKLDIPLIIVSGTIGEERCVEVMKHGATDYILKDRLTRLGPAVIKALDEKRLRENKRVADQTLLESKELARTEHENQRREHELRKLAENTNRLKDQFFATLSHELRTPLTPILGWCRMLLDGGLDEPTRTKGLNVIMRNVKMQAKLIEDILDVSRIITGKLLLNKVRIDVNQLVEAALEIVRPVANDKKLQVERTFSPEPAIVAGDPYRLDQVVSNLLTNAVKFTPNGGSVKIAVVSTATDVEITFKDSGIGIRSDFIPHVFDRFSQADASHTREHGGLGIGLSLVKHLTELHGGKVNVSSEGEGRGATFTVTLPKNFEPTSVEQVQSVEAHAEQTNQLAGITILIVDDELDARELIQYTFNRCGAKVIAAGSVQEALVDYQKQKPDLLISDLGMPFDDGFTLIKEIRNLEAKSGQHTPSIALSAFARDEDRERSLAAGFQMHLPKPIDPVELVAAVTSLLKKTI